MKRPRAITTSLAELSEAGEKADKQEAIHILRTALDGKSYALVAQAAELAARLDLQELSRDLRAAFDRFNGEGLGSDKHCRAKIAIVQALHRLKSDQIDVFISGMTRYWPAPPHGDNRDEATPLRIASAIAYAELGSQAEAEGLVDLLADPVADVRLAAVRALVAIGGPHCSLLLRLKILLGDDNPNVMEECFAGLIDCGKERYLPFVARYMDSEDHRLRVTAALAIGESRHEKALDLLTSQWARIDDPDFKRDLLIAVALLRNERAITFLLSCLDADKSTARDAMVAMSYLHVTDIQHRVEEAIRRTGDQQLLALFAEHFKNRSAPSVGETGPVPAVL